MEIENWLEKMNEMFEANVYTNYKGVIVEYSEVAKAIMVTVCGKMELIQIEGKNDYILMMECIGTVDKLYNEYE